MTLHDRFRGVLLTVQGQALAAAGYTLDESPVQWSNGLFRFRRRLDGAVDGLVDYQLLVHPEHPARFQVVLQRRPRPGAPPAVEAYTISLSRLLWEVFDVPVLPAAEYWWRFIDERAMADALLESGRLLIGYGLPWLDGSLQPGPPDSH